MEHNATCEADMRSVSKECTPFQRTKLSEICRKTTVLFPELQQVNSA